MCYVLNEYFPDCKNSIITSTERKKKGITINMRKDDHLHIIMWRSYYGAKTCNNEF